jgi:hypothetical protein
VSTVSVCALQVRTTLVQAHHSEAHLQHTLLVDNGKAETEGHLVVVSLIRFNFGYPSIWEDLQRLKRHMLFRQNRMTGQRDSQAQLHRRLDRQPFDSHRRGIRPLWRSVALPFPALPVITPIIAVALRATISIILRIVALFMTAGRIAITAAIPARVRLRHAVIMLL